MRITIIYFIGFLFYAAFLVVLDYVQNDELNLQYNLYHALFVTVFIRVGLWFTHKIEKATDKEIDQQQE